MSDSSNEPATAGRNPLPADDAPMVEWAVWNARQGIRVFPLKAGTKNKPTISAIYKQATCDEATIRGWWARPGHENDNPGGYLENHIVVDIDQRDKKNGSTNDWKPSAKLVKISNDAAARAMRVHTRNGIHLYWRKPEGLEIRSKNAAEPFIDVRADGPHGFVVLAGAKVAYTDKDGKGSVHRYRITNFPDVIGELPAQIAQALLARQGPKRQRCEAGAVAPGAEIDSDGALTLARQIAAECPPAVEGQGGHGALLELAMRVGDIGLSAAGCVDLLLEPDGWNDRCAPPWSPEELDYQVQTMFASRASPIGCGQPAAEFAGVSVEPPPAAPAAPARPPRMRVLDLDEVARMPRRECTVEGLIAPRDLFAIFGQPGSGKSLLAPYIALRVARGEPAFGLRTRQIRVLYLACEDETGMGDRLLALRQVIGGSDKLRLVVGCAGSLSNSEGPDMAGLLRLVADWSPGMIFVDTLAMSAPGIDENSSKDMGNLTTRLRCLADLGPAVIAIHHAPKDGASPRGHSVFNGALDGALLVGPATVTGAIACTSTKNRNGRPAKFAFRIGSVDLDGIVDGWGKPISPPICIECSTLDLPQGKKLSRAQAKALDLLDAASGVHGSARLSEWRSLCEEIGMVSKSTDLESRESAFRRVKKDLTDANQINVARDGSGVDWVRRTETLPFTFTDPDTE